VLPAYPERIKFNTFGNGLPKAIIPIQNRSIGYRIGIKEENIMSMVVQNNLQAVNAHNRLNVNVIGTKKATEKLSSGFRINRAGDDAAGLAVSEKMRTQLKGLGQAIRNTNDGISFIQTAEGALEETHAMLKRLKELATQSANGTYTNDDRDFMQQEVSALLTEITRIAEATDFNGVRMLNGSLSTANVNNAAVSSPHSDSHAGNVVLQGTISGMVFQIGDRNGAHTRLVVTINSMTAGALSISGLNISTQTAAVTALGLLGANGTSEVFAISSAANVGTIDHAIFLVSQERAKLGALQNRLEHTAASLTATAENVQAAESQVRDTDMAKEMVTYTKFNILQQAAQAMLAQANQAPQGILQLLR
jgi:flagellin